MSVYLQKDRKAWTYTFRLGHRTYKGSTGQLTREDAEAFEFQLQRKIRRRLAGLVDLSDAPSFQEWAGVYYRDAVTRKQVKRPERIDELVQVVLRFFGRRPSDPAKAVAGAPYHDLQLSALILEPEWIERFEDWMRARGIAGSTRNHYRSTISGMYRTAMLPRFRKITGITENPMVGVPRDRRVRRDVDLEPADLLRWIAHASYHVRLALAIAALAPKLRLANVLALEWGVHVDRRLTRITVADHKTDQALGAPLVVLVTAQLHRILEDARRRTPGRYVVSYRGKRVKTIRGGVAAAARRAGLPYGLRLGVTFHAIRHAVATLFAQMPAITESQRAALMAHQDIATTQLYTHLRPEHERAPLEQLSDLLPIEAVVTQPWRRWSDARAGTSTGVTLVQTDSTSKESTDSRRVEDLDDNAVTADRATGSPPRTSG